ncbi:MAG: cation:proton antiporter [Candidatus Colwellbacteria bacterium]|nr:cation:proton antiporter [Candidatus Colwellbacteria bacterium]
MDLLTELALAIVLAVIFGFITHLLKQPVIIGFLLAGVAFGYLEGVWLINPLSSPIESLASLGVIFLLFLVGLEMNLREFKHLSWSALLLGVGQIFLTFGLGFGLSLLLGFSLATSVYLGGALTFSSTIIVVKLLSDKGDLQSLYGRLAVALLIIQDFAAILVLLFLTSSRILPKILDLVARSQEMLYLFSLAWLLGVALLAVAFNVSLEAAGLLAGLALANSSERFQMSARLRPLRDFFIILFFVALGAGLVQTEIVFPVVPTLAFILFVLLLKPLVILLVNGFLGYRARTSFLTSITSTQISEFSLIIAVLGYRLGYLGPTELSLITLVGLVTIFFSSYFITHGAKLYEFLKPLIKPFEFRSKLIKEAQIESKLENHIILVGVDRMGRSIIRALSNQDVNFVALDFDPVIIKELERMKVPVVYGDITDSDIQEKIGLTKAKVVISTVPEFEDNLAILRATNHKRKGMKIILTAEDEWHGRELYKEGADYVLLPHFIGGQELAQMISANHNFANLKDLKERDLKLIRDYTLVK